MSLSPTERHEKAMQGFFDYHARCIANDGEYSDKELVGILSDTLKRGIEWDGDFLRKALAAEHLATKEEIRNALIDQIRVAILAQETGINDQARLLGLDKWLGGSGIIRTKYQQDKLEGQKDLLRWLESGYFPALLTPPTKTKE